MNVVKILMDLVRFMKNSRLTEAQMKELQNRKLREKMEGYCQSQAGMSLDNYRQELCSEESSMEQGPQM